MGQFPQGDPAGYPGEDVEKNDCDGIRRVSRFLKDEKEGDSI